MRSPIYLVSIILLNLNFLPPDRYTYVSEASHIMCRCQGVKKFSFSESFDYMLHK